MDRDAGRARPRAGGNASAGRRHRCPSPSPGFHDRTTRSFEGPCHVSRSAGAVVASARAASSGGINASDRLIADRDPRTPPRPDPRVGPQARASTTPARRCGTCDWSRTTPSPEGFAGVTNSDLAFTGNYAIQGNYNGFMVWDISNPRAADAARSRTCARRRRATSRSTATCSSCPAKGMTGRLDCGTQGVPDRSARIACAASASSTSRDIDEPEVHRATCRPAAARTRTRS